MSRFARTNFIPPTSYQPRNANLPSLEIREAMRGVSDLVDRIAKDVSELEVKSVRSNKTGNRVDVRVRVGGTTQTLHLCTVERGGSGRTAHLLHEEAAVQILDFMPGVRDDRGRHVSVVAHVQNRANQLLREKENRTQSFQNAYASTFDVERAIFDAMGDAAVRGLDRVAVATLAFLAQGGVQENQNRHQSGRAIDGVRHAAMHAFRHGVDIETIMEAVRETLVANVLTS